MLSLFVAYDLSSAFSFGISKKHSRFESEMRERPKIGNGSDAEAPNFATRLVVQSGRSP